VKARRVPGLIDATTIGACSGCGGGDFGGLASGDGYSVAAGLAELPAAIAEEADSLLITTADVIAANAAAGLDRPTDAADPELLQWAARLAGVGGEDAAPVCDDYETDLERAGTADELGRPLRMANTSDRLAASLSTPYVEDWIAGDAESLADDESLAGVAAALDDANVVAAVLANGLSTLADDEQLPPEVKEEIAAGLPPEPFDAVGIGWAVDDGDAVITIAYHFASESAAEASVDAVEVVFDGGISLRTRTPIAELLELQSVDTDGSIVVATVTPGPEGRPSIPFQMLMERDVPFTTS